MFIGDGDLVQGQVIAASYQASYITVNAVVTFRHLRLASLWMKNASTPGGGRVVITGVYQKEKK